MVFNVSHYHSCLEHMTYHDPHGMATHDTTNPHHMGLGPGPSTSWSPSRYTQQQQYSSLQRFRLDACKEQVHGSKAALSNPDMAKGEKVSNSCRTVPSQQPRVGDQ
jgi:hypothetical protein